MTRAHISQLHGFASVLAAATAMVAIQGQAVTVRPREPDRQPLPGNDVERYRRRVADEYNERRERARENAQANASAPPTRQQRRALERRAAKVAESAKRRQP